VKTIADSLAKEDELSVTLQKLSDFIAPLRAATAK